VIYSNNAGYHKLIARRLLQLVLRVKEVSSRGRELRKCVAEYRLNWPRICFPASAHVKQFTSDCCYKQPSSISL